MSRLRKRENIRNTQSSFKDKNATHLSKAVRYDLRAQRELVEQPWWMVPAMVYAGQKRVLGKPRMVWKCGMHRAWVTHHHCPLAREHSVMGGAGINVKPKKVADWYGRRGTAIMPSDPIIVRNRWRWYKREMGKNKTLLYGYIMVAAPSASWRCKDADAGVLVCNYK